MKFTVTEPSPWKRVLDIEVPSTEIQEEIDEAFENVRKQANVAGFRRGKAPKSLIKARFGEDITQEILQKKIPEYYEKAREEAKIEPLGQAVVEEVQFEEGQPLTFKASVEVKPPLDLAEYTGIRVMKRPVEVTEEKIQAELVALQERHAEMKRVEEKAAVGLYLLADVQSLDHSGVPIIGRKSTNQLIQIGSGAMGPEFDDQLVGFEAGETRRVTAVYPRDFHDTQLAGQEAYYEVTANSVLEKRLPDLDDEFAKDLGAESLHELKHSILHELEHEPEREVREQLLSQLVAQNQFEVPESMVQTYLDRMIANAKRLSREPVNEEDLRAHYRSTAIDQIRRYFITDEIAEREHLHIAEAEIDARLEVLAQRSQVTLEQLKRVFRQNGRIERIESEIKEEKVIEFLMQHADIQVG